VVVFAVECVFHNVHGFNLSPSEELKQGMQRSEETRQSLLLREMSASLKLWTSLRLNNRLHIEVFLVDIESFRITFLITLII